MDVAEVYENDRNRLASLQVLDQGFVARRGCGYQLKQRRTVCPFQNYLGKIAKQARCGAPVEPG
jgi:hypothetical protein